MDLQDHAHGYCTGDTYPREGLEPSEERIAELSGSDNKRGIPLIVAIEEEVPPPSDEEKKAEESALADGAAESRNGRKKKEGRT